MNPSADIFEALAALPDRPAHLRERDRASARILRDRDELFPASENVLYTAEDVAERAIERVLDELHDLIEQLPASSKRAREILHARALEVASS